MKLFKKIKEALFGRKLPPPEVIDHPVRVTVRTQQQIKRLLPRSWFTKKGPGVEASARDAFRKMNRTEQLVCVRRGWVPQGWL